MEKIKAGDVVKLKSGSPEMTVDFDYGDGTVAVIWFIGQSKRKDTFSKITLEKLTK